jgi:PH domain
MNGFIESEQFKPLLKFINLFKSRVLLMEGSLKVWVNLIYRWRSQFFVLHNGVLTFCNKKGGKLLGAIHMKVAKVSLTAEDHLRIIINTGTGELHLRAANVAEKSKWVSALRQSQDQILAKERESAVATINVSMIEGSPQTEEQRKIANSQTLTLLTEKLADLWCIQAQFDEVLSLLQPKMDRQSPTFELTQKLQKLGSELKVKIHEGKLTREIEQCDPMYQWD